VITNTAIILYILALIVAFHIFWTIRTEIRLKKIFSGKKAGNFEEIISNLVRDLNNLNVKENKTEEFIKNIDARLKRSIQGIETIRYNPFPDSGGNQSFTIAMLDENGNGVVLSSLYARERMSFFAKPIKNYKSEIELTEEEKEAIEKAKLS